MKIEEKSIQVISEEERHGSVKDLFTIWFGANMQVFAIITGAVAIACGLNIAWAIVAVLVGDLLGGIFTAYHSAQGPHLGIPQMVQSRAQFGVIGAALPLIVVIFMYGGYLTTTTPMGAAVLEQTGFIPLSAAIIICNIITLIITIYGYDMIHRMEKYLSIFYAVVFAFITIMAFRLPFPEGSFRFGPVNWGSFLLAVSIIAAFEISYAPYVADYSRYLPKNTTIASTFGYTYGGLVLASVWMHSLGVILAAGIANFGDNPVGEIGRLVGPFAIVAYLAIILGVIVVNSLNLYGAFMSVVTTVEPFTSVKVTQKSRITFMTAIIVICTVFSILLPTNLLNSISTFLTILLYFMIPWTAINLVDYYFVRNGEYSIEDIFDVNGKYGRFNWTAILTYIVTFFIEIPFINLSFYQGPISKLLNGADIAWIVGLIFAAGAYYLLSKGKVGSLQVEAEQ
ncbi:purine-cytosine permease family protein [Faecalispora jeddahensis]|uniref:purine-cytosine permease family protein n=1 Tax=Faecalispora jeddahensis TaxID=1414721 RepID=UPI001896F8BB|nr:cytosine permease [Faecalispora jeddahensis]